MAKSYGLVRFVSNKELEDAKGKIDGEDLNEESMSSLASHIRKNWEINRFAKEKIETELLKCLRQVKGEYDPETLNQIRAQGGSEIFMMLTATKKRAGASWIREIMLPAADRPWGIEPTPVPDLPEWATQNIAKRLKETTAIGDTGEDIMARAAQMRDQAIKSIKEIAQDASDRMADKIADQMAEGKWDEAVDQFIDDFTTYPSAIIKGPILRKRKTLKWGDHTNGFKPQIGEEVRVEFERVSPFDVYPSPSATGVNDGNLIERIRYTRSDLYNLIGMQGYSESEIRGALEQYGRNGLRDWLWRDYERAKLENKEYWWLRSTSETIDGLHYWGSAQGLMLLEWGIDPDKIPDPLADYQIDAILIGNYVIRAVINKDPLQRRPYHKSSFEKLPGSFWGNSIPYRMRDIQRMCNAIARALSNNLGIASGPQVDVNVDRLADGEVLEQMYPWKYWQTTNDPSGSNQKAINFFQPQSNAQELLLVYNAFEQKADDATNIPRYSYGGDKVGGAGRTASGLSMLLGNASKGIKLAIANIDLDIIRPIITMIYTFNMIYDKDPMIKGDAKVVARGANAILIKEQAQMKHTELLQLTANPIDMKIIGPEGRAKLLRDVFKSANLEDAIPTDDQIKEQMQMESQQPPPPDPAMVKVQAQAKLDEQRLEFDQEKHKDQMMIKEQQQNIDRETALADIQQKYELQREFQIRAIEERDREAARQYRIQQEREANAHARDMFRISEQLRLEHQLDTKRAATSNSGD